jgi:hypothetical protein
MMRTALLATLVVMAMAIDPPAELQFSDAEGDCTFSKTGSVISLTPSW